MIRACRRFFGLSIFLVLISVEISHADEFLFEDFGESLEQMSQILKRKLPTQLKRKNRHPIDMVLIGIEKTLDPHTTYLPPKAFKQLMDSVSGHDVNVGFQSLKTGDQGSRVLRVQPGSSADKAGIRRNDLIIKIDGVKPGKNQKVSLAGKAGTFVEVTVLAPDGQEKTHRLMRHRVEFPSVEILLRQDILHVRYHSFSEKSVEKFKQLLQAFRGKDGRFKVPLKGVIMDLRNNPGGLLSEGEDLADALIDQGILVSQKDRRSGSKGYRTMARSGDVLRGMEVVVLINGFSASSTEIFAGAMKDHGRATLIGTRSYGKGSVQTVIPQPGGGALKVTTARYYSPSGQSIQARGIEPDIVIEQDVPEELSDMKYFASEASRKNHLKSDRNEFAKGTGIWVPEDASKDKQLQFALGFLRANSALRGPQE